MKKGLLIIIFSSLHFLGWSQIRNFPDSVNQKKVNTLIASETGFYLSGMAFLHYVWYDGKERVPFTFFNDNQGWLQIDKFGHALTAYKQSYIGYYGLRQAGVSKRKALIYGGPLGFVLQAPIEIFDGMYEGWGFSWGDLCANTAGSVLLVGQEILWDDQPMKLKMSFRRSAMAQLKPWYLGENQLESFFYDYNGHTYWLSGNINKVWQHEKIPDWLNLALGYSGENMFSEFENRGSFVDYQRYRQYYLSLDIDWTKIKTKHKGLRILLDAMMVVKLPFPALEYNSHHGLRGHWLYF